MAEERWEEIGRSDELARTPLAQLTIGRTKIALIHRDGEFGAISGVCNHVGGPLGEGRLDGDYVVCPWHNWKFHWQTGQGEPGFEEDAVPVYATRVEDGRVYVDVNPRTPRKRKPHAPHPLARRPERHDGPAARGRHLDHGDGRGQPALLDLGRAARALRSRTPPRRSACETRLLRLNELSVPPLRGLLLEERAGLHLALLDHADGSGRPARPGVRGDRALGRRDPGRDADPLGRRLELALLQDGRAHELHPEPDHDRTTGC